MLNNFLVSLIFYFLCKEKAVLIFINFMVKIDFINELYRSVLFSEFYILKKNNNRTPFFSVLASSELEYRRALNLFSSKNLR